MENVAIVLAAGSGKRMNSDIKKQYMELCGKPLLYYSLKVMEDSDVISDVILVVADGEKEKVLTDIVKKYNFKKVHDIVIGGKERYHSVMNALDAISAHGGCKYVMIHDGARPLITGEIVAQIYGDTCVTKACVTAVRSKDTIKIADELGFAESTPNRSMVWNVQTPQSFEFSLIRSAYATLKEEEARPVQKGITVTDDAMVVETFTNNKVKLVEGSYENIKITTPDDMVYAEAILKRRLEKED